MSKAAITLLTGMEDPEKVTVALLMAVGAAESGRETTTFLSKEGVRLAVGGLAVGTACEDCPSLPELMHRYESAGGQFLVCPLCFNAKHLDETTLVANSRLGGVELLWEWVGGGATTFSF